MSNLIKIGYILLFLLAAASAMTVQEQKNVPLQYSNLGFGNQLGPYATESQLNAFINFVNSGSSFFRNDNYARFQYISNNMNKVFGDNDFGFSFIQQGDELEWGWALIQSNGVYASVSPGRDLIFPSNSYMYMKEHIYPSGRIYFYDVGQKGSGLSRQLEQLITKAILDVEPSGSTCTRCTPNSLSVIDKLNKFDDGPWNVFCSAAKSMIGMVYANSNVYAYTRPANCYYAIYKK